MQPDEKRAAGGNRRHGQSSEAANSHCPHCTTRRGRNQPLRAASGRTIAVLRGDTIHKYIDGSRHILKTPPALAIDLLALDAGEAAGAVHVLVWDRESGATYRASIATIREHGFTFDRGWGRQIALALDYWARAGEVAQSRPVAVQGTLL